MIKISQASVQEFLQKHPKGWFTSRQISEKVGIGLGSCMDNLRRLRVHRLIDIRDSGKRYCHEYRYRSKENEEY